MKKSRYTEFQIIAVLKDVDAGMKVEEVCRQHGISSATRGFNPEVHHSLN